MNERVGGKTSIKASVALSLQVFSEGEPSFSSIGNLYKFFFSVLGSRFSVLLELEFQELLFFYGSLSFVDEADFFELKDLSIALQLPF